MPNAIRLPSRANHALIEALVTLALVAIAVVLARVLAAHGEATQWDVDAIAGGLVFVLAFLVHFLRRRGFRYRTLGVETYLGGDLVAEHGANPELDQVEPEHADDEEA